MGDDEIFHTYSTKLAIALINRHLKWKHKNYSRKCQYIKKELSKAGLVSMVGAVVGVIFGGLSGAIFGALSSGAGSFAMSWFNS